MAWNITDVRGHRVKEDKGRFFIQVSIPEDVKEVLIFSRPNVVETVSMIGRGNSSIEVPIYDLPAGMCTYIREVLEYCGGEVQIYRIVDEEYEGETAFNRMLGVISMRRDK